MTPLLSIVTVVRNDAPGLLRTAASLEVQTWQGFEWVVKDGASNDGTLDAMSASTRIPDKFESSPDGGIYGGMNAGMALASGDWLLFLNAGDVLCQPETLQRVESVLKSTDRQWGFGAVRNIDARGVPSGLQSASPFHPWGLALGKTTVPHQAAFMRRALLNELGGFRTDFGTEADQELLYRASLRCSPFEIVWPIADFQVGGRGMGRPVGHFVRAMRRARRSQSSPLWGNWIIDTVATGALLVQARMRALEDAVALRQRPE